MKQDFWAHVQFKGRLSRKEYWLFLFRCFLIYSVLVLVAAVIGSQSPLGRFFSSLDFTYALGAFVPMVARTIRRLHDTGTSGWCVLLLVIPLFGPTVLLKLLGEGGEPVANRYGDPASLALQPAAAHSAAPSPGPSVRRRLGVLRQFPHAPVFLRTAIRAAVGIAALTTPTVTFGADAPRKQGQAHLLEQAELRCANCLFASGKHYYCFAVDNQILVGYQQTRVVDWRDDSKNYVNWLYPQWAAGTTPDPMVPISYDDSHIWVSPTDAQPIRQNFWTRMKGSGARNKPLSLKRTQSREIFTANDQCRATVAAHTP